MTLLDVLNNFRQDPAFMRCVTAWERISARPARLAPWPAGLDPHLVTAIRDCGIEQPYTHQAQAVEAALAGQHVVLSTSTASGKTLAYNLPILHTMLNDTAACALYLFPTKALAHDQVSNLKSQTSNLQSPISVRPYDGDTPSAHRPAIRREARLLVTNPDMLHTGILPHHTRWARLFSNLRYVVLDELHTYRGIFGGHVANVLRRLRRVCHFYGSHPRLLCASATIANPRELAEQIIEAPVTLVDDDGAPRGEKHFILYNPPLVDQQLGIRRSATLAAKDIAARFLQANVQTIVFARARLTTEVLLGYLRDSVAAAGNDPRAVQGYRGGYLPNERRTIEQGLCDGKVRGVVATNALELGVDIGQLDACIMTGYPGTIASAWQQSGRAGRRVGLSAAVLVASALPLDQYLITHPHYFFGRPVEQALLDPDNLAVLVNHLTCATFELPFETEESFGNLDVRAMLDVLAEDGMLHQHGGRYTWIGEGYPAGRLSLRTSTPDNVVIQDVKDGASTRPALSKAEGLSAGPPQVIGQMDRPSAPMLIHEGAVYLHGGTTYVIESLDWEGGIAYARAAELDYYTRASSTTDVRIVKEYSPGPMVPSSPDRGDKDTRRQGNTVQGYGEVLVTTRATGYRKIKRYTHEVLAWAPIDLPEQELHTIGYWLALSEGLTTRLQASGVLPPPANYGPNWPAQRDATRARDNFRCRQCGTPERENRQHDVHHITPFRAFGYVPGDNDLYKLANRLENLITLCPACHHRIERTRGARGALSGLAYLLRNLAPLHLMCDPGDLGSTVQAYAPETGLPTITLYDRAPGGAGLSIRIYELHAELLEAALDVVRRCPCADGCPSCVGPTGDAGPGTKSLTRQLLEAIVDK
ncbi:MAG: DEAD/DEAH box helicase [Chloroflexota bacterium]|nr:DEAD/DEAH box helicase [Chloroflexota bacterium]